MDSTDSSSKYSLSRKLTIHTQREEPDDYNAMEDFRNANYSGIDNKILIFQHGSYPAKGMKYFFNDESYPRIYIRKCYEELYDLIMKTNTDNKKRYFLITGTPGIGKSMFTLYFMKRYYEEHDYSAIFGFQRKTEKADIIIPNGQVYRDVSTSIYQSEDNLVFFCDLKEKIGPSEPDYPKLMIVISSPDDSRYKEYAKQYNAVILTMPVWSKEELDEMFDLFEMERLHEKVIDIMYNKKSQKQTMFDIYGGVPRSIMTLNSLIMEEAIASKGPIVVENYFIESGIPGTGTDIENNYKLVHVVPSRKIDGTYMYNGRRYFVLASKYVLNILNVVNKGKIMRHWFNYIANTGTGGIDASLQGNIFEWVYSNYPPIEMKLLSLNKKGSRDNTIINKDEKFVESPTIKTWPDTDTISEYRYWTSSVLYFPNYRTLESGDAFFIQGSKNKCELFILQLTVAKSHPVKAKGLLKIVKYFKDSGYEIGPDNMKMNLVFVTPMKQNVAERVQMTNYQAITSKDINVRKKINEISSIIISEEEDNRITKLFENESQWIYYYDIPE